MPTRTATRATARRSWARSSRRKPATSTRSSTRSSNGRRSGRSARSPRAPQIEPSPRFERARAQLRGHRADALAIALLVFATLLVLGLAGDLAGAVGGGLADGSGALLGQARYAVPVACVGLAVMLFLVRPASRDDDDTITDDADDRAKPEPALARVGTGVALLGVSLVGALHLSQGSPPIGAATGRLRDAGGYLGAGVAEPLEAAAGMAGAGVVLGGLAFIGLLLVPGLPVRDVVRGLRRGLAWAWHQVDRLGELPAKQHAEAGDEADAEGSSDPVTAAEDAPPPDAQVADHEAPGHRELIASLYDAEADVSGAAWSDADEPSPTETTQSDMPPVVVEEPGGQMAIDVGPRARGPGSWTLPPADLLARGHASGTDHRMVDEAGKVLEAALHTHGVDARLVGRTVGPTVTRYELELAPGVKVSRITALGHDIAYAMASADVRILAPIPGRSAIGVEVPNRQRELVTLGDILGAPEAKQASGVLEAGLGRDIAGRPVMLDLAALPHLLIAGATGSGKSSCINSLVTSLLMRNTPDQVRLILVDPKRVELGAYNDLPHLLTPVVTNPKKAANALDWTVREMDMRYEALADVGVRDIAGYNAAFDRGDLPTTDDPDPMTGKGYERLPYIVVVVDELNDLMMVAARDVEASICRIAQMARAVGIHLVIATQRPSVDVITGVIKANIPSRLAFAVSSLADSRVVLDQSGAEKLIGQGDLLLVTASSNRPQRIQGAWVDEACIGKVAAHWKRQASAATYVEGIAEESSPAGRSAASVDADDELLEEAMELVVRSGFGSTSMLQRKLRVGFSRAGRLMDLLERKGVVGPSEGSKARAVLMTADELDARPVP